MFPRGRNHIREAYDDHFMRNPGSDREVTFHRVVNIVERRSPLMGGDFDIRGHDGPMYNEPMPFQNPRDCIGNDNFPQNDMPFYENEDHRFGNYRRTPPPHRNEGAPSHFMHNRDDLRHHLESRNNGRSGNYFRNRGRESAREDTDYRRREGYKYSRDRSPVRRGRSSSSGSRPAEKSSTQQKPKSASPASPAPPASPKEDPPITATISKESPPASVAEPEEEEEEEEEEVQAVNVEPEQTPDLDLKARRSEAIKAKALEIEKAFRQDCENFRTVVTMLVEKEPSLEYLLQAPLEKNLEEIKGHCLDSLKLFIRELDEAIGVMSETEQPMEGET